MSSTGTKPPTTRTKASTRMTTASKAAVVTKSPLGRAKKAVKPKNPYQPDHRKGKRTRMGKSCFTCHLNKRKCNNGRPCSRCKALNQSGYCAYELETKDAANMPLIDRLFRRISDLELYIRVMTRAPMLKTKKGPKMKEGPTTLPEEHSQVDLIFVPEEEEDIDVDNEVDSDGYVHNDGDVRYHTFHNHAIVVEEPKVVVPEGYIVHHDDGDVEHVHSAPVSPASVDSSAPFSSSFQGYHASPQQNYGGPAIIAQHYHQLGMQGYYPPQLSQSLQWAPPLHQYYDCNAVNNAMQAMFNGGALPTALPPSAFMRTVHPF